MLLGWLAGAAPPAGAAGTDALPLLHGDFEVVALRRASGVEGTPAPGRGEEWLGQRVSFRERLVWLNGEACEDWSVRDLDSPPVDLADPNLSDLRLPPVDSPTSAGDRRLERPLEVTCREKALAGLVAVDRRVLVVPDPSGVLNLVLEKPLGAEPVRRLQQQLRSMKFYSGDAHGRLDPATQAAVAHYADYRGADYVFRRAALTENLLDGLGVLEPASDPAPEAIKIVYSGQVAAHFGGEVRPLQELEQGVDSLWFRFEGDPARYPFSPSGTLTADDWRFDVFSPDGAYVLLLQDRHGPYHLVRSDGLKAYLQGQRAPDLVVGRAVSPGGEPAVHSDAEWTSPDAFRYSLTTDTGVERRVFTLPR